MLNTTTALTPMILMATKLAQPARKKPRQEKPSRKSSRIDPPRQPPPRGPPREKPKQTPAAELLPEALEERRKLHNDLIELPVDKGGNGGGLAEARDEKGKIIISDTALRYLLPPQLRPMTERHKLMCGCETCLVPDSHQRSLNAFRGRLKHALAAKANAMPSAGRRPAKQRKAAALLAAKNYQPSLNFNPPVPWHLKPGLALGEIQCQPCHDGHGFPHWDCVLRCCDACPEYPIPKEEQGTDDDTPKIRFHVYMTVTECTKHGKITPGAKLCDLCKADPSPSSAKKVPKVRSRKHLTEMCTAIGTFHKEHYLPALEKLAYHRRIPCACAACLQQLALPWRPGVEAEAQPMFASSTGCMFWPIFKKAAGERGINDWRIVKLEPKKQSDPSEEEEAREEVLAGMTEMMAQSIETGKYGAFATTDEDADGYYVVKWTSEPYTLQDSIDTAKYGWAMKAGELVCDAEYYNKVGGASLWYSPTKGEERKVKVRVQQVVAADLTMLPISSTNALPANMGKKAKQHATGLNAVRLDGDEHEQVLDEINRRAVVEHDEAVEESSDDENDESEGDESEGAEE